MNRYILKQIGLMNAPYPEYEYEYEYGHIATTALPVIPVAAHKPINIQKNYSEYYNNTLTPIDRAYQISRATNCMGPAPRLPGLLPCPYGTDAIACAHHAA